jgi:hypothetical protein
MSDGPQRGPYAIADGDRREERRSESCGWAASGAENFEIAAPAEPPLT